MRTVANIMTANPKMIGSGDTLTDVLRLFLENGITSSPVINPLGEILGMLSELTLLKAYMLHKTKFLKSDKVGHHIDLLEPVSFVKVSATLAEVLKDMIATPTHRLLVKDDKEKIVGIISPKDLMRAMLGEANPNQNIRQKLLETQAALAQSSKKIETIERRLEVYQKAFQETPYMMHAVNADGKILMANRCEHELLGYEDGELIGKSIYDIYPESVHSEAERGLKTVIEQGFHHITYTTLVKKDGGRIRCDIASSSLLDEGGKFLSTITVLRAIDSEALLRSLHGIVDDINGPLAKYISISEHDKKAKPSKV
ncbi:CBS domain-containing protein [Bdellovibrio svalbardensis]|uniref:CBS domain-containing protein n=1 Tax=Bdellovibrio svalbardensis TaxID=2972972 RepID=A0ABT6DHI2_9BACT|nr:CBS domain-containing protein [Bdellovibrio svalbardensis]MDG0816261.1 CBS domain-containing protein [Bdellovibrio svalbardensis]